jgi:hypothetical protein
MPPPAKPTTRAKPKTVSVIGLVHPLGAGGASDERGSKWAMNFSFVFWRAGDGPIDTRTLLVSVSNLTTAALDKWMSRIPAGELIRVHLVFKTEKKGDDIRRAELVKVAGSDFTDAELTAKAEGYRKPVTVKHPFLGTLTLDRRFNWYEAEVPWNSRPVRLSLSLDDCDDEPALLKSAHDLFKKQKTWDRTVRDFAVQELLDLKNDTWLGDREKKFTPNTFKARMTLETITLNADGEFEFWFHDGNLFWGHSIQISGTLADGPTDADIPG